MSVSRLITISTATKRNAASWQQKTITWQQLIERCRNPKRTEESVAQYFSLPKEEQSAIKDVGGFVGGSLKGKRRSKETIASRDLITLDLDHAQPGFWEGFSRIYRGTAAFCYSTHSHTPENPRLRLIIPLSHAIPPDAYEPIARSVAHDLGMDQFDDSTYEASRLMYFPSCPKDGEYVFEEMAGDPLNPDVVLSGYDDWHDAEQWPTSSREAKRTISNVRHAEDPLLKEGIVGDFCRYYSIAAAIEKFLPEIYARGTQKNRYTYVNGTTTNGLVIYDGKFAHAFQSTDPLCDGHTYNAFDLVRLHLFRAADKPRDMELPVTERSSYKKMLSFIYQDQDFIDAQRERKLEEAKEDFAEVLSEGEEQQNNTKIWKKKLKYDKNNNLLPQAYNFQLLLANLPEFKGKFWFDEFEFRIKIEGKLPWDKSFMEERPIASYDYELITSYFIKNYMVTIPRPVLLSLIFGLAKERSCNPVCDYLNSLKWDGVPRLDTLAIDFLAAKDEPLTRAMMRKHLVAAVKRAFKPGCKYDNVIIFTGAQGTGKTTLVFKLGGKWAKPLGSVFEGKTSEEQLIGGWIFESGEMSGWSRSEIEGIKGFFSKTSGHYRPAYGMAVNDYPRQCIFFATTNDIAFLRDSTGNRRFWPIAVRKGKAKLDLWRDFTDHYRDQVWAEAVTYYRNGENTFLDEEQEKELERIQLNFTDPYFSDMVENIRDFLEVRLPPDWYSMYRSQRVLWFKQSVGTDLTANLRRDRVTYAEIRSECFIDTKFQGRAISPSEILRAMEAIGGWQRSENRASFGLGYGRQRYFERILDPLDTEQDTL